MQKHEVEIHSTNRDGPFQLDLSVAVDSRRMPEAILKVTRKPQHGHFQSCI
jgi:hypothetical protein